MKWNVLISAPYLQLELQEYRDELESRGARLLVPDVEERLSEEDLLPLVGGIDGVIAGDDAFTRRVINAAPRLKVISKWGTGIDSFDQDICRERGIAIRNVVNAFSEPVADTVLGYTLMFARRLVEMDINVKLGAWRKEPGRALNESTLGIVGYGNVGHAVARRAAACGMQVLVTDIRNPDELDIDPSIVMFTELGALLGQSDFVSLNCDLNETSQHLINSETLALMRTGAVLINTSRGSIIDEFALVAALDSGKLAGAALDVFEVEPVRKDHPLLAMDNVRVAAHNSNSSPRAWRNVHRRSIDNLFDVLGSVT